MLGCALAVAVIGMQGHLVQVEADITLGLPAFSLVGLPDASLSESRARVRAATANSGHPLPQRRITVNLSPAGLPKAGTGFDLAIAVALLAAAQIAPAASVRRFVHVGELGLDGRVRPVRGVLPAALAAVQAGRPDLVVPVDNVQEARLVPGARVQGVRGLTVVIVLPGGGARAGGPDDEPAEPPSAAAGPATAAIRPAPGDLADVIGQLEARRALEVVAA